MSRLLCHATQWDPITPKQSLISNHALAVLYQSRSLLVERLSRSTTISIRKRNYFAPKRNGGISTVFHYARCQQHSGRYGWNCLTKGRFPQLANSSIGQTRSRHFKYQSLAFSLLIGPVWLWNVHLWMCLIMFRGRWDGHLVSFTVTILVS